MEKAPRQSRLSLRLLRGILLLEAFCLAVVILVIFGVYRPKLQQQTLDEATAAGSALSRQIDIAMRSVAEYSDFYANSPELGGALEGYLRSPSDEHKAAVCDILSRMLPTGDTQIRSVFVMYGDELFTSYAGLAEADRRMLEADWIYILKEGLSDEEFAPFYTRDERDPNGAMMYLRNFYLSGNRYLLGMVCSTARLRQDVSRLAEGVFSGYALASMSGPYFLSGGETSGITEMLETHALDDDFQDRDSTGYYVASTIASGGWKIIGFLSNENFNARFVPVLVVPLLMCLLMCLLAIFMVFPFARRLLRPVEELRDAMEQTAHGDMDTRVTVSSTDEIGQLGGYFNNMLDELRDTRDKERAAQQQAQRTQYDLLTSQINAHYIYNTMSAINSLARMGRCDDVVTVNSALIRILQSSLRMQDGSLFSTVRAGVDTLNSYWKIESIRPNNHAKLTCDVQEEVLDLPLLKNILQPLVENGLRHGLADEETGEIHGRVSVTITRSGSMLRVCVEDDGRGVPEELLSRLNGEELWDGEGRHIGLANIRKRLDFAFEGRASMKISSNPGTCVEIFCPLEQE